MIIARPGRRDRSRVQHREDRNLDARLDQAVFDVGREGGDSASRGWVRPDERYVHEV